MITVTTAFSADPLCCKLADVNPDWFFSEEPHELEMAQSICMSCPVRKECLDWAITLEREEKFNWGVYGGLTHEERKALF